MALGRYMGKRVAGIIGTYFVIATIVFSLFRLVGSPLGAHLGMDMSPDEMQAVQEAFGINQPWHVQYYDFITNLVVLDWGTSFYYGEPVVGVVVPRLINSLFLTIPAILMAYFFGAVIGVALAWRRGEPVERLGLGLGILFRSTPRFWVGLILLFVFGVTLAWFPLRGIMPPGYLWDSHLELVTEPEFYRHLVLPILSMTFYLMGLPLLLMRTSILEEIHADYVKIVRAKGGSERTIMYKHAARNALLPVTTAFAVALGYSMGGNVLVETVFTYPGIGRLMVDSVFRADYPAAQFAFLTMAAVILVMNLIADIAYAFLDPRVRY
jgi:peptide/nickel transport system permease protein